MNDNYKLAIVHPMVFKIIKKIKLAEKYQVQQQTSCEVIENDISVRDQELIKKSKFLLVSAWPKSGSTYLTKFLSVATECPKKDFVQFYGHNEQDLYEQRIRNSLGTQAVIHQHIKAGENNLLLMKKYGIKPIILVRNIFDTILSVHDHIENEANIFPMGYIHKQYDTFSFEEKIHFLVKNIVPWYFNFHVSWIEAEQLGKIDFMWITYEELFSERKKNKLKLILSFWDIKIQDEKIEECLVKMGDQKTRLNVGKSGRGASLPTSCKEEIISLAKVWKFPLGTFKRIGIFE